MKVSLPHNFPINIHKFMQRTGYHFFQDPRTGKESYSLRLSRHHYPRFHAYIKQQTSGYVIDVHLDQKQASYRGQKAHSGEYSGPQVEAETERLQKWIDYFLQGGR